MYVYASFNEISSHTLMFDTRRYSKTYVTYPFSPVSHEALKSGNDSKDCYS